MAELFSHFSFVLFLDKGEVELVKLLLPPKHVVFNTYAVPWGKEKGFCGCIISRIWRSLCASSLFSNFFFLFFFHLQRMYAAPIYKDLVVPCPCFVEPWTSCCLFLYDSQGMEATSGCWV
uniref:Uncharacterized protein n=1 Tax=Opuntia streptacantha TaxID=393608 RepID=A0A7C8ZNQ5_OPUST